jgi:hypothetical protein
MPPSAFSTVGGYGGNPSVTVDPATGLASGLVDTADGTPILSPQLQANGSLMPAVIDPVPINPAIGIAELTALVIEMRVLIDLISMQMGTATPDIQSMRADHLISTTPITGLPSIATITGAL